MAPLQSRWMDWMVWIRRSVIIDTSHVVARLLKNSIDESLQTSGFVIFLFEWMFLRYSIQTFCLRLMYFWLNCHCMTLELLDVYLPGLLGWLTTTEIDLFRWISWFRVNVKYQTSFQIRQFIIHHCIHPNKCRQINIWVMWLLRNTPLFTGAQTYHGKRVQRLFSLSIVLTIIFVNNSLIIWFKIF